MGVASCRNVQYNNCVVRINSLVNIRSYHNRLGRIVGHRDMLMSYVLCLMVQSIMLVKFCLSLLSFRSKV